MARAFKGVPGVLGLELMNEVSTTAAAATGWVGPDQGELASHREGGPTPTH